MAATKTQRNNHARTTSEHHVESPKEITHDVIEYLSEYTKENPGYTALACLAVGFVLGWKLKPW